MKALIPILIGLLVVGCGKTETERLEEEKWTQEYETEFQISEDENKRLKAEIESNKIEAENKKEKDDLLRLSAVGEYEWKHKDGNTYKQVLLENGVREWYDNGKKAEGEVIWKIVDEKIHTIFKGADTTEIYRINKDGSITCIGGVSDGRRIDLLKKEQVTWEKIKSSTHAPPPERSLEVQFLDGELNRSDLEEVTKLNLDGYQLTELPKNLENLTQLKVLVLSKNQLTEVPKGLEKLTQLRRLNLKDNPDLTKAQIAELQKGLPKCKIEHNAK